MLGCMRYLSILPAVDDGQLGKQSVVPLTGTDGKTYYSYPERLHS